MSMLQVRIAASLATRLRGLIGRSENWLAGGVLVLVPCSSVHTFGMRRAIDIAFVDGCGNVLAAVERMRPCRVASCRGAVAVLERLSPAQGERVVPWFSPGDVVGIGGVIDCFSS